MKKYRKAFSVLVILLIVLSLGIASWYMSRNGILGKSGVDIEVITGAGGMPPFESQGTILTGELFTVIFTEPFQSLDKWESSKVIKEISTTSGMASIDLSPGKYGVYYIYKDQKILYGDLILENPRNDIQRNKQGPWFIRVNILQRTKLLFSVNSMPV
jgi:hypothetical protein